MQVLERLTVWTPPSIFLEQPSVPGLAGTLAMPAATHHPPPLDHFNLTMWQPNPNRADGLLVPVTWKVGDLTGFYPAQPETAQQGFAPSVGTTAVQAEGPAVGAYINSRDLIHGSRYDKMMASPGARMAEGAGPPAFPHAESAVRAMLYLQVPTATDAGVPHSLAYVSLDLEFEDATTGAGISYGTDLFSGATSFHAEITVDPPTGNMMVNGGLFPENPWIVIESGVHRAAPWLGLVPFGYAIPAPLFAAALAAMRAAQPDFRASTDPADYRLRGAHLNAELQFAGGPASLGWSMQGLTVALT